jgi:hypothetical protein
LLGLFAKVPWATAGFLGLFYAPPANVLSSSEGVECCGYCW